MNLHTLRLVDAEVARRLRLPVAGNIGEGQRELEIEPLDVPVVEPIREPAQPAPAPEPVPA